MYCHWQNADAAAKARRETAAKQAEKEAVVAAAAQTRNLGAAQVTGSLSDKYLKELAQLESDLGGFLSPEFKKVIQDNVGPQQKNRQLVDMLMKYARKANQAARALVCEEKAKKAAELKQQQAQASLKRSRELAMMNTTSAADNLGAAQTAAQAAPVLTEAQRLAQRQVLRRQMFG